MGTLIRLMLVCGWAGFLVYHIIQHAAPWLGIADRSGAILSVNLDKTYAYSVVRTDSVAGSHIGTFSISFERLETGFELETILQVNDIALLAPGLQQLLPQLGDNNARTITARLSQLLDNERRLTGIRGSGSILGLSAEIEGEVDEAGLHGTYTINDSIPTAFNVPEIKPTISNGNDLVVTLPPGLEPGERFTTELLSPDIGSLRLRAITAVFTVEQREPLITVAGPISTLRVRMEVDNKPSAKLWCDDAGVVYRSAQHDGIALQLISIQRIGGDFIWPTNAESAK